jgi:hypothetical protein
MIVKRLKYHSKGRHFCLNRGVLNTATILKTMQNTLLLILKTRSNTFFKVYIIVYIQASFQFHKTSTIYDFGVLIVRGFEDAEQERHLTTIIFANI